MQDHNYCKTKIHKNSNPVLWPRSSNLLCWYCGHLFNTIPVFLPKMDITKPYHYNFTGNFCSWNCVKSYQFENKKNYRKDTSYQAISLLAFLTSYRPRVCPILLTQKHGYDCPCLDEWKGLLMAPPKQCLVAFGGNVNIDQYRKDFMTITDYRVIEQLFFAGNYGIQEQAINQLVSTPQRRMYTYTFERHVIQHTRYEEQEQKQQEQMASRPVVHKQIIKHKALF